jgi:hypothetical protein
MPSAIRSKYRAIKTEVDGIMFASKKEAARYQELKMLLKSKEISDLELQPRFPLEVKGVKIATYVADFRYKELTPCAGKVNEKSIIEDVKGMKTSVYRLKKKLFEVLYNQKIQEV